MQLLASAAEKHATAIRSFQQQAADQANSDVQWQRQSSQGVLLRILTPFPSSPPSCLPHFFIFLPVLPPVPSISFHVVLLPPPLYPLVCLPLNPPPPPPPPPPLPVLLLLEWLRLPSCAVRHLCDPRNESLAARLHEIAHANSYFNSLLYCHYSWFQYFLTLSDIPQDTTA